MIAQLVKNLLAMQETRFDSWVGKIPWRRDRLPTPVCLGFSGGSAGKESACNAGDPDWIPGSGRSPGEGIGYPLQYSRASLMVQLVKNLPAISGDLSSIHALGRSPGEGKGYPLQDFGLEKSMDCILHGVTKSHTLLSLSFFSQNP